MMGCAIGMSVAAACELIYWFTLKPIVKLMANYSKTAHLTSVKAKKAFNIASILIFLTWLGFCLYQSYFVFIALRKSFSKTLHY